MPKKKSMKNDPFAGREAENYANPIPSREYILEFLEKRGQPATHDELATELLLFDDESQEALRRRLNAMQRDGQLITNRAGLFGLVKKMDLVKGRIQGNREGFGFLIPEDGTADLFLSPHQMQKVFDGDIVLCRVSGVDHRGRKEGKIVEVLEHKNEQIVGRYYCDAGVGLVEPHNPRITQEILIPPKKHKNAKDGDFVTVQLTRFPLKGRKASGEVVEILGDIATPGLEIEVALRQHEIPHEWPKELQAQLRTLKEQIPVEEIERRIDLRDLPFVTIDGEDAKDFDDAVYCKQTKTGWTLYVAIADVSHYVKLDSALDTEGQTRGNSVYFPGHVIPMLPEVLSNGLCSLRPHEDRLVMVCRMDIDKKGVMTDYSFFEGIIFSNARLTYTEVGTLLQPATTEREETLQARIAEKRKALVPDLQSLYALYKALRVSREKRGALDIDSVETRIIFSEERKIKEIIPVERNDAHKLIEECMLCANVASANFLQNSTLPALYRVHEGPNPERLDNLYEFLREMGIGLAKVEKPTPLDYQNILKRLADRPDRHMIQTMVIRSLMQAVYQPENLGHFGLGFAAYTHFTSPIRRYPDLMVHRAIRYLVRSRSPDEHVSKHITKVEGLKPIAKGQIYPYELSHLEDLGVKLSATERRADQATYDVINWLKCEYVSNHLGEEYEGTVTSVTGFGLFVELNALFVEGLIHVTALANDYYHYDAVRHTLTGERSGNSFHLGDSVTVQVAKVDMESMRIDLQLTGAKKSRGQGKSLPKRSRSRRKTDKTNQTRKSKPTVKKSKSGARNNKKTLSAKKGNKTQSTPKKKTQGAKKKHVKRKK